MPVEWRWSVRQKRPSTPLRSPIQILSEVLGRHGSVPNGSSVPRRVDRISPASLPRSWQLLAGVALGVLALAPTPSLGQTAPLTLDLNGQGVTLPDAPYFTTPYLTGTTNVVNSGAAATLSEGGGSGGESLYTGHITGPVSVTHTSGLTVFGDSTPGGAPGNTYSGTTTISSGTLQLGAGSDVGFVGTGPVVNDATLQFAEPYNYGSSPSDQQATTIANAISGTGSVLQQGPGTVLLSGNNTYSGTTTVAAPDPVYFFNQLLFASSNALPKTEGLTLQGGGLAGTTYALDQAFLDRIAPSVGVAALGADSSNNLDFSSANLKNVSLGAASGACDNYAFCTRFNYSGTLTPQGTGAGTFVYNLGGGNAILNVTSSLGDAGGQTSLQHGAIGDTILSGTNSYTGGTFISKGALQFATPASIPNFGTPTISISSYATAVSGFAINQAFLASIASGSQGAVGLATDSTENLDFSALPNVSLGAGPRSGGTYSGTLTPYGNTYLLGGGAVANQSGNLTVSSALTDVPGAARNLIVNDSQFTNPIDVFLINTEKFTGSTQIQGGRLWLGNETVEGNLLNTSNVTISNGAALIFREPSALNFDRSIDGGGDLIQFGAGTVTLNGALSYTGYTVIENGTLSLGPSSTLSNSASVFLSRVQSNLPAPTFDISGAGGDQTVKGIASTLSGTDTAIVLGAHNLTIGTPGVTYPNLARTIPVFAGTITGKGGLTFAGNGVFFLSGSSQYSGGTIVGSGTTLTAGATNTFSPASTYNISGALDLAGFSQAIGALAGSGTVTNSGSAAATLTAGGKGASTAYSGTLQDGKSQLALVKTGQGTLELTVDSSYTGGTEIAKGTVLIDTAGGLGTGTVSMDNGTTLAFGNNFTFTNAVSLTNVDDPTIDTGANTDTMSGAIGGAGQLTKLGSGTLTLTGINTYAGGTTITAGTLVGSATSFGSGGILDNAALVLNQPTAANFANPISGTGTVTKTGAGLLDLTGTNTYAGPTTLAQGTLLVDGLTANSVITAQNGPTLGGFGTVGGIVAQAGATVAPGLAVPYSTLKVAGNVNFQAGSTFGVQINAAGQTDLISGTGTATIGGGTVAVTAANGAYNAAQRFTILTAAAGRTGTFSNVTTTSNLAFLSPYLLYSPTDVILAFQVQNPVNVPVCQTVNQRAAQSGIAGLGAGNQLYDKFIGQTVQGAQAACDATSGEIHASAATAAFEDNRFPRESILDRLDDAAHDGPNASGAIGAFGAAPGLPAGAQGYAPVHKGYDMPGAPAPLPRPAPYTAWGTGWGDFGRFGGDGNAAALDRSLGGFVLGVDTRIDGAWFNTWHLGVAGGYSNDSLAVSGRSSTGTFEMYYGGLYAGAQYGAIDVKLGALGGGTHLDTSRSIAFPGFLDQARSSAGGVVAQGFGEVGYKVGLPRGFIEPFAQGAVIHYGQDGFAEAGGVAALRGFARDYDFETTILGLKAESTPFANLPIIARAVLGWRHVFGDLTPGAVLAFEAGGPNFTVFGAPIDQNAVVAQAGLDYRATSNLTLGISYSGQAGERAYDNAVKGRLEYRF